MSLVSEPSKQLRYILSYAVVLFNPLPLDPILFTAYFKTTGAFVVLGLLAVVAAGVARMYIYMPVSCISEFVGGQSP